MTDRLSRAAALCVPALGWMLVLGAGGCGGSSHASSGSASGSSVPPGRVRTAPPPTPSGTPPAPPGLRQTTGYGMYEGCAGRCSGAVPPALRRALHIPRVARRGSCAAAHAAGPVRPGGAGLLTVTRFVGSAWAGGRVTWRAAPGYSGPVLIRGRQIDGSGAIGFGEGHTPYDELQLLDSGQGAPPGAGRTWLTFTRVREPGCYAYQVDGTGFSEVIVFRVAG